MNRAWTVAGLTAAVVATLGVGGCQPPPKPAPQPVAPPPPMTVPQARAADASGVDATLSKLSDDAAGLPGHSEADHRAAAAAVLADLNRALRLAYGRDPSPGFTDDVTVVDAAAVTVAMPDVPRGRMEGAETQALHAAAAALGEIATRVLYDDPDLPPLVDAAAARADAARDSQGPLHDGDVTDAVHADQLALNRVSADLDERFNGGPAVPVSMVRPTATPTTAPATMP